MDSFDFVVEGSEFVSAVSAVAFALNPRDKNAFIGFKLCGGDLMVEAGNGHFSVDSSVQIEHDSNYFAFSFRLKDAINICKAAKGKKAEFWYAMGTEYVNVFIGGAELKIQVFENETKSLFLTIQKPDYRHTFELENGTSKLVDLLKTVAYAQAKNDVRYYLCGINLSCKDGQLRLAATDGNRLATQNIGNAACHDFSSTLHFDIVSLLQKQAKKSVITVNFYKSGYAVICFDLVTITAETSEMGKFPDLDRPAYLAKTDNFIELYKSDLLNAIKTLFNGKGFCPAGISINNDNSLLTLATKQGSISVPASVSGISAEDVGGVNLPYLYDVMLNCDHDFLRIYCNQGSNIYKIESTEQTHIIAGCKV